MLGVKCLYEELENFHYPYEKIDIPEGCTLGDNKALYGSGKTA